VTTAEQCIVKREQRTMTGTTDNEGA